MYLSQRLWRTIPARAAWYHQRTVINKRISWRTTAAWQICRYVTTYSCPLDHAFACRGIDSGNRKIQSYFKSFACIYYGYGYRFSNRLERCPGQQVWGWPAPSPAASVKSSKKKQEDIGTR